MKKIVSILLASLLLLSVLPLGIFAAEPETVEVGTADALVSVITDINSGIKADNTNITLTADIDLSGNTDFLPLATYSGVFDGDNHTISGLSKTIVVANNNEQSVDAGKGNIIYRWSGEGAFGDGAEISGYNCWGYCGMATLFVMLTGTVKDLTVENGTISLDARFNKNIRMDLAYIAGYALNATFDNVHAVNIDVTMPITPEKTFNTTNENQGHMGGTAIFAGRASGNVTFKNCTVDSTSAIDTSNCPRMDAAGILGIYDDNGATNGSINTANAGTVTFDNCTSEATVTVSNDQATKLMWDGARCDGVPGVLYKTIDGGNVVIPSAPVEVATAAELQEVITKINAGELPFSTSIVLTEDIDCSEVASWKPLVRFTGVFDGGNHKITGLSQAIVVANNVNQSVDAGKGLNYYRWSGTDIFAENTTESSKNEETGYSCYAYCGFATLFVKLEGTVKDLTVKDGSISLDAQYNKNNRMDLAYVAGYALNATFENVHAINIDVSVPTKTANENQGRMGGAAIFAGRASGNTTFTNCTVDSSSSVDTSKCPRMNGAGILGAYDDNGATDGSINTANAGDLTFNFCSSDATVTVCTDNSIDLMFKNGVRCDGVAGDLFKANDGGNLIYGTKLEDSTGCTFYYQTRINKDDPTAKDYRIICIADRSFIEGAAAVNATITFTDGVTPKTFTPTATTVFNSVSASGEGYTDVYYANEGDIVFGWVVTGVPAAYQTNPTATATVVPVEAK